MEKDAALEQMVKKAETDRGKRVMTLLIAVVVVGALIAVVAFGFRGRRISENAAAIAKPVNSTANVAAPRPVGAAPTPAP